MNEDDGDIEMQIESDDEEDSNKGVHSNVRLSTMENRVGLSVSSSAVPVSAPPVSTIHHSKKDNNQVQDMDEASSDEESPESDMLQNVSQPPVAPPLPPTHDKVIVKKYDPKQAQKPVKPAPADEYLISPITGEKIPASKVAEHMRIGLLDPRWVEQRDKHTMEKINQENVSLVVDSCSFCNYEELF